MNKRIGTGFVFALALAAQAAAAPTSVADTAPAYLRVTSFSTTLQADNLAKLSVSTQGEIPRKPDAFINANPVVGLAWADLSTGKVFVATIHPVIGRDSLQNPDSWHGHTATLAGGASAANTFCVTSIDSTPTAGIQIHDNTMDINVRADLLAAPVSAFTAAVGFTIQSDLTCGSGLAVRVVS